MNLKEWARAGRDPWYSRLRGWLADKWLCEVKRLHMDKLDSYGRCYRCGRPVRKGIDR